MAGQGLNLGLADAQVKDNKGRGNR